ncbi:MAG: aminopeptidase P family protein [Lachnospiraceae bacterium]|nr:aminopeptidase P family protein [Lachnospiraceae bacterium]
MITERLAALRRLMKEHHIDAYLVPTDDFHCSEYVGDHFKCREFITGFTGSAGTAIILQDQAGLWTDGRYFLQAASQLEGSTITLYKSGEEGVPATDEFLQSHLKSGQCLGFDGRTMTAKEGLALEELMKKQQVSISCQLDLIDEIWTDRPALSAEPAWTLELKYAGKPRNEKISQIRKAMAEKKADYFLLTSLDDIAWLLNLRGNDVSCNPVVLSYLAMTQSQVLLFAQEAAVSPKLQSELKKDGIALQPYDGIYAYAAGIPQGKTVWMDCSSANYTLKRALSGQTVLFNETNPTQLPKAIKNSVEMANVKKAHIKDGVALTRFIYWLKQNIGKTEITELSASAKLEAFRAEGENYQGPSFDPILSYGTHAAIVHYSATPETDIPLKPHGLLLADTGGQYLEGTTDVTRTIVLGETTDKEKEFFTRVLRGNLNLAAAKFLYGCNGRNLDYLAREPLWEVGEDYNHGTGHGVGYLLNVHEGPQGFRWKSLPNRNEVAVFEEGMLTSDEPGFYLEGEFGIRHENLMLCKKAEKRPCGQFMEFDTLTLVPFDLEAVLADQMSEKERALLNQYHKTVFEKISPYLPEEEKAWLREATREI